MSVPPNTPSPKLQNILQLIIKERTRQDLKWGGPNHDDRHNTRDWAAFIVQYLGEAVKWEHDVKILREAMVKVAALAIAAIEWCDRRDPSLNPVDDSTQEFIKAEEMVLKPPVLRDPDLVLVDEQDSNVLLELFAATADDLGDKLKVLSEAITAAELFVRVEAGYMHVLSSDGKTVTLDIDSVRGLSSVETFIAFLKERLQKEGN